MRALLAFLFALVVGTAAAQPGPPPSGGSGNWSAAPVATVGACLFINGTTLIGTTVDATKAGDYTVAAGDMCGTINLTGAHTLTIPAISSTVFPNGGTVCYANIGNGNWAVSTTPTINSIPSATLLPGASGCLVSNGTTLDCQQCTVGGTLWTVGALSGAFSSAGGTLDLAAAGVATSKLAAVQGNGAKVQLANGSTPASGNCAKFDASANVVDNGAVCGASASSVTSHVYVNAGSPYTVTLTGAGGICQNNVVGFFQLWGAGGGGGGGATGIAAAGSGAGGGGGGGYSAQWIAVSAMPATATITVPAGGAGGTAGNAGSQGGAGANTTVVGTALSLSAAPGGGGFHGATAAIAGGGGGGGFVTAGATGTTSGGAGGDAPSNGVGLGSSSSGAGANNFSGGAGGGGSAAVGTGAGAGGLTILGGGSGGGAGGAISASGLTPTAGANGGLANPQTTAATGGASGGTNVGGPGAAGGSYQPGSGGAGGGGFASGTAGGGGVGGLPAGGGGGGGSGGATGTGGTGGTGGGGQVTVTCY